MAGLGDLIENYVTDPVRKVLGVYTPDYGPTELPELGYEDDSYKAMNSNPLEGFRRSTRPRNIPQSISAYRGDEKKGGIETLPMGRFDKRSPLKSDVAWWERTRKGLGEAPEMQKMYAFARLSGAAKKLGLPAINPQQFAAMVLKEGRPDAGFNAFLPQAKPDVEFRKKLDRFNIPEWQKNYLGMINYADRVSKKNNIPFEAVWNGTGKNWKGQSGFDYAKAMKAHEAAALHPKNKDFMGFINRAFQEGEKYGLPTMKEKARDTDPYLKADPKYKYHTPEGKRKPHGLEGLFKAEGGVVIDDGNPAKQRKLI